MEPIVLLRPDKAGDAVKTLAVLRALKALGTFDVHVISSIYNTSLFEHEPQVRLHPLPTDWQEALRDKRLTLSLPSPAKIAINLLADPTAESIELLRHVPAEKRYARAASVSPIQEAKLSHGPAGQDERENISQLVSWALFETRKKEMEKADKVGTEVDWRRFPDCPVFSRADHEEAAREIEDHERNSPWLAFCPFAGLGHRTPSLARFSSLLRFIHRQRHFEKIFVFGTAKELDAFQSEVRHLPVANAIFFKTPSSFRALGAYFQRLDAFIGVDSGPLHLARAIGTPSLGILSGGDVERWFPPCGAQHHIIRRGVFSRFPALWEIKRAYQLWRETAILR